MLLELAIVLLFICACGYAGLGMWTSRQRRRLGLAGGPRPRGGRLATRLSDAALRATGPGGGARSTFWTWMACAFQSNRSRPRAMHIARGALRRATNACGAGARQWPTGASALYERAGGPACRDNAAHAPGARVQRGARAVLVAGQVPGVWLPPDLLGLRTDRLDAQGRALLTPHRTEEDWCEVATRC
jgi:hypothetical protein